jgi:AcrR family transcriptional regulator
MPDTVGSRTEQSSVESSGRQGGHVVEMQRRRLLTETVEVVFDCGARAVNIAAICQRAGVSRKTFYDIFEERETCLLAAFEEVAERARDLVEGAVAGEERWRYAIRAGLVALLSFLDREPGGARLLIVEALAAGAPTLNARKRVLAQIIAAVDRGRTVAKASRQPPPMTAEGVVGAVFAVIHARMLEREERPLTELTGALMAMIVHPYLGAAAAERELARPVAALADPTPRIPTNPFKDLPIRLTYRTARVLSCIAAAPGASSKQIATASGVADEGQMSRLLTRLERVGLVQNTGAGPATGEAKAWRLTERGEEVLRVISP